MLHAVIEEETGDLRPYAVCRLVWMNHHGEDLPGDHGVQPGDDAGVGLEPLGVVAHQLGVECAINVAGEPELVEHEVKEGVLGGEIGFSHVEGERHMRVNVDHRDGGGW